jgi:hypothetical protein
MSNYRDTCKILASDKIALPNRIATLVPNPTLFEYVIETRVLKRPSLHNVFDYKQISYEARFINLTAKKL